MAIAVLTAVAGMRKPIKTKGSQKSGVRSQELGLS